MGMLLVSRGLNYVFFKATARRAIGFRVSVKGASTVTVTRYLPRYLTEPNPCWVQV